MSRSGLHPRRAGDDFRADDGTEVDIGTGPDGGVWRAVNGNGSGADTFGIGQGADDIRRSAGGAEADDDVAGGKLFSLKSACPRSDESSAPSLARKMAS